MRESTQLRDEAELLHHEVTRDVIAAFYEVKNELGPGLPEYVYANAVAVVLRELGRNVVREARYEVAFHGVVLGGFRADLVVEEKVVVEVKTAHTIVAAHREQLHYYLFAAKLEVGLVLTFGENPDFARVLARPHP